MNLGLGHSIVSDRGSLLSIDFRSKLLRWKKSMTGAERERTDPFVKRNQ